MKISHSSYPDAETTMIFETEYLSFHLLKIKRRILFYKNLQPFQDQLINFRYILDLLFRFIDEDVMLTSCQTRCTDCAFLLYSDVFVN